MNRKRLSNQSGLTMSELMVAMAISSITVLAALSMTSNAIVKNKALSSKGEMANDSMLISEFFAREIPNAGGLDVMPEAALFVEDDCSARGPFPSCDHSDRLTIATAVSSAVCQASTFDTATGVATFAKTVDPSSGALVCCLSSYDLLHKQIMFTKGSTFAQRWVLSTDANACNMVTMTGPMTDHENAPPLFNWGSALVVPIDVVTYYLDSTAHVLKRFNYDSAAATSGQAKTMMDHMFDFQVSLGFDFNPIDGQCVDTGTTTDEWLYNAPGAVETRTGAPFQDAAPSSLRMIGLGWVTGARSKGEIENAARVLNGPSRTASGWMLQDGYARLGLKSVYIFE